MDSLTLDGRLRPLSLLDHPHDLVQSGILADPRGLEAERPDDIHGRAMATSPSLFVTGMDSPVIIDSSTADPRMRSTSAEH
jgi:hypothetical protein